MTLHASSSLLHPTNNKNFQHIIVLSSFRTCNIKIVRSLTHLPPIAMLAKLPVLVLAGATFVAADFKLYWFSTNVYDPSAGASTYTGIKFLSAAPDCETFRNANGLDSDFDGDVSYSGYTCDGCDENVDWNDWRPSRIEINNNNKDIFTSEPYHISR
jgi:hypothetical protein